MSHYRLKTEYVSEGVYGNEDSHVLYVHHNLSCDVVTFYNEDGTYLFSFDDTMKNNMLDAINRLAFPFNKDGKMADGVISMTNEEREKFKL